MIVNSPYSGKPMRVVYENDTWDFRGEKFPYVHIAFRDDEHNEQFTTTESVLPFVSDMESVPLRCR